MVRENRPLANAGKARDPVSENREKGLDMSIAISWSVGHFHGWGVYGLNLMFAMLARKIQPLLLQKPGRLNPNPLEVAVMLPVLESSRAFITAREKDPEKILRLSGPLLLKYSDGDFDFSACRFEAEQNVGMTFFENPRPSRENREAARALALVITGSRWNESILKDHYNLTNVTNIMQGVDTTLFFPSGRRNLIPGRFIIFSGGKLEHRKGQDIVLAVFKRFLQRHSEALLMTAWSNVWSNAENRFDDRLGTPPPAPGQEINDWLGKHLPQGSFMDVGSLPNPQMPPILREAHVALFPNRCEGGTNLVAMECMATGLPVILADNTGHRDLTAAERCYILKKQGPVNHPATGERLEDWGESDIDEAVEHLEAIYANPGEAGQRGNSAHRFMAGFDWRRQCGQLLDTLSETVS